jgi:hypothetical protein
MRVETKSSSCRIHSGQNRCLLDSMDYVAILKAWTRPLLVMKFLTVSVYTDVIKCNKSNVSVAISTRLANRATIKFSKLKVVQYLFLCIAK